MAVLEYCIRLQIFIRECWNLRVSNSCLFIFVILPGFTWGSPKEKELTRKILLNIASKAKNSLNFAIIFCVALLCKNCSQQDTTSHDKRIARVKQYWTGSVAPVIIQALVLPALYLLLFRLSFLFWSQPRDSENDNRPEKREASSFSLRRNFLSLYTVLSTLECISRSFPFSLFISHQLVSLFADLSLLTFLLWSYIVYTHTNIWEKSKAFSVLQCKKYGLTKKLLKHVHRWPC